MGAMSTKYNNQPEKASRAFDADRDGFVIAGGGGMVVLEELEHARARGAKIYAEVTGYGATSDGHDMVAPVGRRRRAGDAAGARRRCRRGAGSATSTPTAPRRRSATSARCRRCAGSSARAQTPPISSTKSMTGHSQGATGAQEAIYCLLMLRDDFIAPSINVETLDPELRPGGDRHRRGSTTPGSTR